MGNLPPFYPIPHGTPSLLSPIIPNQGVMCSDVRNAQKQRLTIVGKNDTFLEAVSLLAALHLINKCKSNGEKPRNKARDLLYQFLYQRGEKW